MMKCGRRSCDLHKAGESPQSIMAKLGVSPNTVRKWIRAESLPTKAAFPEEEVLALLKERMAQKQISKVLKVPFRQIVTFARAHGFGSPHFHPTPGQVIKIIEMALGHQYSVAEISRAVRSPYDSTRTMVKTVLECERLISGGQGKLGLDSYFPSKYRSPLKKAEPSQDATPEQREALALHIVNAVHRAAGSLPETEKLIELCSLVLAQVFMRGNPDVHIGQVELEKIKNYFEPHLLGAVDTLHLVVSGPVN